MNRRELGLALSAFAALRSISAEAQSEASAGDGSKLVHSALFSFDKLPVNISPNGMTARAALRGTPATGE
jgi:hypothetical protein